jgi:APA family basic amino acid/polyamine antiporter
MDNQLFARKPHSLLLEELRGESRLRRVLGPIQLSSLGVGAIIGTGIFVLTGIAAHDRTGPALMLSFVVAGLTCIFAALCYAEFASMVPVAGSAYTYAYATLGELMAWIIGWDLVLEYAVASATVAHGWSHYFQDFLLFFNVRLPHVFTNAPFDFDLATGRLAPTGTWFDLPAIIIAGLITVILVKGIQESASVNAAIVMVKLAIVLFVIVVGARFVNPAHWIPFAPYGYTGFSFFGYTLMGQTGPAGEPVGMLAGAAIVFFAYIGFDSVSTHAEEARNPSRDVPIGIIVSLVLCTVLYIAVAAVLTGMVPYNQINIDAPVSDAFRQVGLPWAQLMISVGAVAGITSVLLVMMLSQPRIFLAMAGRIAPHRILRRGPRTFPHALEINDPDRLLRRSPGRLPAPANPGGTGEHRHAAGLCDCLRGSVDHAAHPSRGGASVPRALGLFRANRGNLALLDADVLSARGKLAAPGRLAGGGPLDLLHVRPQAQRARAQAPPKIEMRASTIKLILLLGTIFVSVR